MPTDDEHGYLPSIQEYTESAEQRQRSLFDISTNIAQKSRSDLTKKPLAFA